MFLSTSPKQTAKHTQSAPHRTARSRAGLKMIMMATGLAHPPSTTLRLLISGNLVAPLKMENWGIHHSSKMERDGPNSSMCWLKCCKMCYEMQPYHCQLMWHVFQERRSTDSFSVSRERGREEDMRPNNIVKLQNSPIYWWSLKSYRLLLFR